MVIGTRDTDHSRGTELEIRTMSEHDQVEIEAEERALDEELAELLKREYRTTWNMLHAHTPKMYAGFTDPNVLKRRWKAFLRGAKMCRLEAAQMSVDPRTYVRRCIWTFLLEPVDSPVKHSVYAFLKNVNEPWFHIDVCHTKDSFVDKVAVAHGGKAVSVTMKQLEDTMKQLDLK